METLSIIPSSKGGAKQSDRRLSEEKRQAIVDYFCDDPCSSQRQAARELEVSQSSVNRVLKEEGMRPFKFTRVHELTDQDFEQRKIFCSLILSKESQSPSWTQKIAFSDEATFHLNGQVNLHNSFIYGFENPKAIVTHPMKSSSVTVWAMITFNYGILHHVFEGTVNQHNYTDMLIEKVVPFIRPKRSLLYQQDGAPAHFSLRARDVLNTSLPQRWIGRASDFIRWPPRSPDLAINDFWLWGYVRDNVYQAPRPTSLNELTRRIIDFLENIDQRMIRNAYRSFLNRCEKCYQVNGGHFEQLL